MPQPDIVSPQEIEEALSRVIRSDKTSAQNLLEAVRQLRITQKGGAPSAAADEPAGDLAALDNLEPRRRARRK